MVHGCKYHHSEYGNQKSLKKRTPNCIDKQRCSVPGISCIARAFSEKWKRNQFRNLCTLQCDWKKKTFLHTSGRPSSFVPCLLSSTVDSLAGLTWTCFSAVRDSFPYK